MPNTNTLPYRGGPAGGGYSTVEDLARFGRALLGHKLLSPHATRRPIAGQVGASPTFGRRYASGFVGATAASRRA